MQACLRADVEMVLMSGRRRAQVNEDARLLGQCSFIFEAGACVVLDGEEHWLTGELLPGELTIAEQIERSGAPALLLERYAGRLEYHEPWHVQREVSHLFRGLVDAVEVDRAAGGARPREPAAGGQRRRQPPLGGAGGAAARARLSPGAGGGVEGGGGGAAPAHPRLRARGDVCGGRLARGPGVRAEVDTFWLVANAVERDPSIREAMAAYENVRVCEAGHGAGVYEAVLATLMERATR